jgi:hypothetical protein
MFIEMQIKRGIYVQLALAFFIASTLKVSAQEYCSFLKKVQSYQDNVKLLDHKNNECNQVEVDTSTFNVTTYRNLFDKLMLPPGMELCFCNFYSNDAGQPLLYVRPNDFNEEAYFQHAQKRFCYQMDSILAARSMASKKDSSQQKDLMFIKRYLDCQKSNFNKEVAIVQYATDSINKAKYNLIPSDTIEGFVQLLFFNRMGDRFALYWHSNYGMMSIICSQVDMQQHLEYYKSQADSTTLDKEKLAGLTRSDVSPKVSVTTDAYFIEWYEFEPHNGLFKRCFKIERRPPYRIKQEWEEKKLEACLNFFY